MRQTTNFHPIRNPASLSEVNHILNNFSLPKLSPQEFDVLKKNQPRDTIVAALQSLQFKGDRGAYNYLAKQIQQAQAHASTSPKETQAPARRGSPMTHPSHNTTKESDASQKPEQSVPRDEEQDRPKSVHVYGSKAALCFEEDETRGGFHTVALDAATATGPKQYNWSEKIRIQLTREEMPVLLAVMLGVLPHCEYKNHGTQNNKGFAVEDQGDQFFVRVFSPDGVRAVPMTPEDAFRVTAMLVKQMRRNYEGIDSSDILTLVRVIIGKKGQARKERGDRPRR
jgi:hypothetical protein